MKNCINPKCKFFNPETERVCSGFCAIMKEHVTTEAYSGYKRIVDCRFHVENWKPDYSKHECLNPKCKSENPMDVINESWGNRLLSVMYKCNVCGRIDGEIWDIKEQDCIVSNNYMESKYGEYDELFTINFDEYTGI